MFNTSTEHQLHHYVPHEKYVRVMEESLKHEEKADELQKLGKDSLAAREYQKALQLEERCLGKKHPVVKDLRHSKVDLPKPDGGQMDWKRTAHRPAADALAAALHHEQEGEYLHKLGCQTKALHEYDAALQVEAKVPSRYWHARSPCDNTLPL